INDKAQGLLNEQESLRQKSQELQKQIETLDKRIEKRSEAIKEQARDTQVKQSSGTNVIDVVLNAESFTDAVSRVQAMTTIVKANNDLVEQQKADKAEVEQ
ncbi:hypothetical protein KQJ29_30740, partial [Enterococcus sp. S181_ASV_20]|nr:hypothetical protein [Enterococcus sp. S181_ASV_20]